MFRTLNLGGMQKKLHLRQREVVQGGQGAQRRRQRRQLRLQAGPCDAEVAQRRQAAQVAHGQRRAGAPRAAQVVRRVQPQLRQSARRQRALRGSGAVSSGLEHQGGFAGIQAANHRCRIEALLLALCCRARILPIRLEGPPPTAPQTIVTASMA